MFKAYTDGACRLGNPGLCSSAFILYSLGKDPLLKGRVLPGRNTNNIAEYTALLDFLKWADQHAVRNVVIYSDSELVVNQVNQNYECNKPELKSFMIQCYGLLIRGGHMLKHVKGHSGIEENERVDALCNELLDKFMDTKEFKKEYFNVNA